MPLLTRRMVATCEKRGAAWSEDVADTWAREAWRWHGAAWCRDVRHVVLEMDGSDAARARPRLNYRLALDRQDVWDS